MGTDIMAESQTETVLAALDRGEADDKLRDQVSAALLRSLTKIAGQLSEVKANLRDMDKIEGLIDKRHQVLCSNCVLRQQATAPKPAAPAAPAAPAEEPRKRSWIELVLTSESTRYFILMLILVWAVIYMKTGPDGTAAVRDAAKSTLTGGPHG